MAAATEANTERILEAALGLFVERPFDQITLASVAERAGVGLQTVIRRVGTKDGLVRAAREWMNPMIDDRGARGPLGAPGEASSPHPGALLSRHRP